MAQEPAGPLEFEAASIKPNKSGSGSSSSHDTSGQLVATNMTLRDYVRWAYGVRDYQISGPPWMSDERFDIVAKIPPHTGASQVGPRLQKLLAERFKLAIHREMREFPVYALVEAKGGAKIKPVEDTGGHGTNSDRGRLKAERISMARLAEFLASRMDKPVVDQSGLNGVYTFTLEWAPDEAPPDAAPGPTLLVAIQQQLGLRLQQTRAPIEMIVIDHLEKTPVEN